MMTLTIPNTQNRPELTYRFIEIRQGYVESEDYKKVLQFEDYIKSLIR